MESWQEVDKYFILFTGTIGMSVLCFGLLMLFRGYHKRLMVQQEEKNKLELQYRDQLILANLQATEKERARIARELHDEVGASLSLLSMQTKDSHGDTSAVIDAAIDSVRRIAYDLQPPTLKAFGITAAVQDFCEKVSEASGVRVEVVPFDKSLRFDEVVELSVYRIIQELVHNTLKHAGAKTIDIHLRYADEELQLTYCDNGRGYDATLLSNTGLGLKNIELRTRLCNGKLFYNTTETGAVLVTIKIHTTKKQK